MFTPGDSVTPPRQYRVKNTHGTDCPPFGVGKVVGIEGGVVQITRPDADDVDPRLLVAVGPWGVKAGKRGQATPDWPWWAAGAGEEGDEVGTTAGSWALAVGRSGLVVWQGGPGGGGSGSYLAPGGPIFVNAGAAGPGGGSEMRIIRPFAGMSDPNALTPTDYVTAPFACSLAPDNPPIFYLATTDTMSGGCLSDDCGETIDSCNLLWATPLYQPAYTGGLAYAYLAGGMPYHALKSGDRLALDIDTMDGPPDGDGHPTSNVRTLDLPVYTVGVLPVTELCDNDNPVVTTTPY